MLPLGPHRVCSCLRPKALTPAPAPAHLHAPSHEGWSLARLSEQSVRSRQRGNSQLVLVIHALQFLPHLLTLSVPGAVENGGWVNEAPLSGVTQRVQRNILLQIQTYKQRQK